MFLSHYVPLSSFLPFNLIVPSLLSLSHYSFHSYLFLFLHFIRLLSMCLVQRDSSNRIAALPTRMSRPSNRSSSYVSRLLTRSTSSALANVHLIGPSRNLCPSLGRGYKCRSHLLDVMQNWTYDCCSVANCTQMLLGSGLEWQSDRPSFLCSRVAFPQRTDSFQLAFFAENGRQDYWCQNAAFVFLVCEIRGALTDFGWTSPEY